MIDDPAHIKQLTKADNGTYLATQSFKRIHPLLGLPMYMCSVPAPGSVTPRLVDVLIRSFVRVC